jgi:tetratricopeptide (TPR) repeat protein
MLSEPRTDDLADHDRVYAEGWRLIKGEIRVHDGKLPRPGWFVRRRLKRALTCFRKALAMAPRNWSAMWATGKIHQRLGNSGEAFDWFACALDINPQHPDLAREAGILAPNRDRKSCAPCEHEKGSRDSDRRRSGA